MLIRADPDVLDSYTAAVGDARLPLWSVNAEYHAAWDTLAGSTFYPPLSVPSTKAEEVDTLLTSSADLDGGPAVLATALRELDANADGALDAADEITYGDHPELWTFLTPSGPLGADTATGILRMYFDQLDVADDGGGNDGIISTNDLEAAAEDPTLPPAVQAAARYLLDHPGILDDLDTASALPGTQDPDGRISETDAAGFYASFDDPRPHQFESSFGRGAAEIPYGASMTEFPIPVWEGYGTTRIQYFIDDDEVCLSGTGPDIACGAGDDRGFATGQELTDYELPARVRIILDHEAGVAMVIAYPTHGEDGEVDALPIELTTNGPSGGLPDTYPSQVGTWTEGEGITGNVAFNYRFVNSVTPEFARDLAPAIAGRVRVRQGPDGEVLVDGDLAQYPSVEIIRDTELPNGYRSTVIHRRQQETGGPLSLLEEPSPFEAEG